jgi:hypothetical protein
LDWPVLSDEHAKHVSVQAVWQQTLSTQNWLKHSVLTAHAAPRLFWAEHAFVIESQ